METVTSFGMISFHKADTVPFSMAVLIPLEILSLRAVCLCSHCGLRVTAGFAGSICVIVPSSPGPGPKAAFVIHSLIWHEDVFLSIPWSDIYHCKSGHRKAELMFPLDVASGYHRGS